MSPSLTEIYDSINAKYFNNKVCAGIGWRNSRLGKTKVAVASCNTVERFIRVNSVLQDAEVPLWFLEFVVYHEMIHAMQGPKQKHHDQAFLDIEMVHPDYTRAREFELLELPNILRKYQEKRTISKKSA